MMWMACSGALWQRRHDGVLGREGRGGVDDGCGEECPEEEGGEGGGEEGVDGMRSGDGGVGGKGGVEGIKRGDGGPESWLLGGIVVEGSNVP